METRQPCGEVSNVVTPLAQETQDIYVQGKEYRYAVSTHLAVCEPMSYNSCPTLIPPLLLSLPLLGMPQPA